MWSVQLLGGLAVRGSGKSLTRFRTRTTASLLAYLAFHCREGAPPRPREVLVEMFWPDTEPGAGRHNLSNALSALRHVLEPPGVQGGSVVLADRSSVWLNPAAVATDVSRFEALANRAVSPRCPAVERVDLLRWAAAEYGGRLLPGFYEEWITSEAERLAVLFLRLIRESAPVLRAEGELDLLLACAQRASADDPWSEEALRLLMEALVEVGDPSRALRHYREFERRLSDDLSGEPSAALREYADGLRQVRGATPQPKPARPEPGPPHAASPPVARPATREEPAFRGAAFAALTVTRFFDRQAETALLTDLLRTPRVRLVTLTGPGGTGKTRLALETARQLARPGSPDDEEIDGPTSVTFVPLAELGDGGRLPEVVLRSLGVLPQPGRDPLEQAADALDRESAPLLVLDNFEHLVESGAPHVSSLLARVPHARCLVTSRRKLLIDGEREMPLSPLPIDAPDESLEGLAATPGIQLFIDRAQMSRPDFQLTPRNAGVISELCSHLEGLPLAVELAAARVSLLTPAHILEGIRRDRLDFLVSRRRDAVARHRSLRATLDWSYELLPPEACRFLAQLSVFRAGWTLEAAVAVTDSGDEAHCLELLEALLEASLIHMEEGDYGARYTLLETVRQYAVERLAGEGGTESRRREHAQYFTALAERDRRHLRTRQHVAAMTRLEREHENFRATMEWAFETGDLLTRARLGAALGMFWRLEGYSEQALDWFSDLAENVAEPELGGFTQVPDAVLVRLFTTLVSLLGNAGRVARSEAMCRRLLALTRETGDPAAIAEALSLWVLHSGSGSITEKLDLLDESLRLARQAGDRALVARVLHYQANFLLSLERRAEASAAITETLALYRDMEDPMGLGDVLRLRATYYREIGRPTPEVRRDLDENLDIRRRIRDRPGVGMALNELGDLALHMGDLDAAWDHYDEAAAIYRASGWGDSHFYATALVGLAQVSRARRRLDEAWRLWRDALKVHMASRYIARDSYCLLSMAEIAIEQRHLILAARLLGAGKRRQPADFLADTVQQLTESLSPLLDAAVLDREMAAGRDLSDQDLLDLTAVNLAPADLPSR